MSKRKKNVWTVNKKQKYLIEKHLLRWLDARFLITSNKKGYIRPRSMKEVNFDNMIKSIFCTKSFINKKLRFSGGDSCYFKETFLQEDKFIFYNINRLLKQMILSEILLLDEDRCRVSLNQELINLYQKNG